MMMTWNAMWQLNVMTIVNIMTHDINFYEISFISYSKVLLIFVINNNLISHDDNMACYVAMNFK